MNSVYNFIYNLDLKGKYVIAAISGGPDSMCLLDILIKLSEKIDFKIVVAHVHHNLRKESDYEALEVEKFSLDHNLIFEMKKIESYPNNKFSEEAARKIRYEFFNGLVKKYEADILFTAHHSDDLIETILMRIMRGSNLKGYSGFSIINEDRGYKIAKPLIYLTKNEILEYLEDNNIWYASDISNLDNKYKRNRIRNNILPILKSENKNIHYKFLEYNKKILDAYNYINKVAISKYDEIIVNNSLDVFKFNDLDDIIKIHILEIYLNEIYGSDITHITDSHLNIIKESIEKNSNIMLDLPLNKKAINEYNKFRIVDKISKDFYDYEFTDSIVLPNNKKIKRIIEDKDSSNYVIHLNKNDIKLPFHVRNLKTSDKMSVKNMVGTKKVSDIFTNSKISKEERYSYPIVTDSNGTILWIPGVKKSNLDRKKDGNYDIILKYY